MPTPSGPSVAAPKQCHTCGATKNLRHVKLSSLYRCSSLRQCWTITEAGIAAFAAVQTPEPPEPTAPASARAPRPLIMAATIEARARQRAHAEHVHIFAVASIAGAYRTRSKSDPSQRYDLVAGPDGIIGCSCRGFEYRASCKHSEALKSRLAREAVQAERGIRHLQAVA